MAVPGNRRNPPLDDYPSPTRAAIAAVVISAAALVLTPWTAASRATGHASCSRATAHQELLNRGLSQDGLVSQLICADLTGDGAAEMAITLGTTGSAGVVGLLVLSPTSTGWRPILSRPNDYRPTLLRLGHDLLEYVPVYRKGDPNCCASGGTRDTLYRWDGTQLTPRYSWRQTP